MKWVTGLFVFLLVVLVVLANQGQLPDALMVSRRWPGADKLGHFILMGTLALLVNLCLGGSRVRVGPWHLLKGSVLVALFVSVEELSQLLFPLRSFSIGDLLADYTGIVVLGSAAMLILRRREPVRGRPTPGLPRAASRGTEDNRVTQAERP